jgi:hypothetical protein
MNVQVWKIFSRLQQARKVFARSSCPMIVVHFSVFSPIEICRSGFFLEVRHNFHATHWCLTANMVLVCNVVSSRFKNALETFNPLTSF